MQTITLNLSGLSCAACANAVQKVLNQLPGVEQAQVNFGTESAEVQFDPQQVNVDQLCQAVDKAGYKATPADADNADNEDQSIDQAWFRLWVGIGLTTPLMALALAGHLKLFANALDPHWMPWLMMVLATPVQFYVGWDYYTGAVKSLRNGMPNMDVLIAMGSSIAYGWSLLILILSTLGLNIDSPSHFAAAAMIITFIRVGKFLEARARRQAGSAVRELINLKPPTAWRLDDNDQPQQIPGNQVQKDDRLLVKPGEQIPVDGMVLDGTAAIDTAAVTGEPLPRQVEPDDPVIGGTINLDGKLIIKAEKVGKNMLLDRVIELVRKTQADKPALQRIADRVAAVFVPIILVIALLTAAGWFFADAGIATALMRAATVMVIACPCALGLATPVAIVAATARAASMGIVYRSAQAIESAGRLQTVVFDKTGTLTVGKPTLKEEYWFDEPDNTQRARIAGAENTTSHPLAQALYHGLIEQYNIDPQEPGQTRTTAGKGIEATFNDKPMRIGRPDWLEMDPMPDQAEQWRQQGYTVVAACYDNKPLALFAIGDQIRDDAEHTIQLMHRMHLDTALLSGDHETAAQAVARRIGIDKIIAQVLPDQKHHQIEQIRNTGRHVAMVGDGINDGPALAAADIGIAIGSGTDLAVESADVILMNDQLVGVPRVIALARHTRTMIYQNLFWALIYNLALVPTAAGVYALLPGTPPWLNQLHPATAALAMALSSLCVVLNSLRLNIVALPQPVDK